MFLDITPIMRDALNQASTQVVIAVGNISEEVLPGATLATLEPDQGVWGMIRLHVK